MNARPHARSEERGFTLIELLVAAVAGLFVILAAFLLSRGSTRLFASQGRVANAQLNLRIGIDRLRMDLERAGFMATANAYADPDVSPKPSTLGYSARLQSIYLQQGSAATSATDSPQNAVNGLYPDRLTLMGNFSTTDSFLAADIGPSTSGGGVSIILQKNFGSTARLMAAGETSSPLTEVQSVFAPGRLVRVRNLLGSSQFLLIASASITADGRPQIDTVASPKYVTTDMAEAGGDRRTGGTGNCIGCEIAPVQFVQYSVKSLAGNSLYGWAYPDSGSPGDANKYDLVREEVNLAGTPIDGTQEIVSEYVVDLAFAFSVDTSNASGPGLPWQDPQIQPFDFGAADNATWGGDVSTLNPAVRPQRIRSVRYRLTTRTRTVEASAAADDGGPGLMRYQLGTGKYARASTVIGEVTLANQRGIRW